MPNVTNESDKFAESPQNKLKCLKIKKSCLRLLAALHFARVIFLLLLSSLVYCRSLRLYLYLSSLSPCVCAQHCLYTKSVSCDTKHGIVVFVVDEGRRWSGSELTICSIRFGM